MHVFHVGIFSLIVVRFIQKWIGDTLRREIPRTRFRYLALVHLNRMVQQWTTIDFEIELIARFTRSIVIGDFLQ